MAGKGGKNLYGWRARIGKITPSRSDTFAYEFYKIAPEGVVLVLSGFGMYKLDHEAIENAYKTIELSALDLARAGVDFIVAGGGVNLFSRKERGSDREAVQRIEELTGVPCTTSITADMDAFRRLGIYRLVVATPFEKSRNDQIRNFLELNGFEILNINGMGIRVNADIARVPVYQVYRLAKEAFLSASGAEGVFIPCSRWPTLGIVKILEDDLKVPVITSTTAVIWKAFDRLRLKTPIKGFGRLLAFA